jgi:hypothetical protein
MMRMCIMTTTVVRGRHAECACYTTELGGAKKVTEKLEVLDNLEVLEALRRRRWTIDHRTMDSELESRLGLVLHSQLSIVP